MAATIRFSVPIVRYIINHKQFLKCKKYSEQLCFWFLGLVAGLLPLEVSAPSVRRLKMSSAMLFSPQTMNTFDPTSQVCSLIQSRIQGGHKKSNINGPHGKKTSLSCIIPHYTLIFFQGKNKKKCSLGTPLGYYLGSLFRDSLSEIFSKCAFLNLLSPLILLPSNALVASKKIPRGCALDFSRFCL